MTRPVRKTPSPCSPAVDSHPSMWISCLPFQASRFPACWLICAAPLNLGRIRSLPTRFLPSVQSVGEHLRLKAVRMPKLKMRREYYRAISGWCSENGFERTSVWGFKKGGVPRYSSVTRNGYIGIGPGAGSQLADGFILNTFDLRSWAAALEDGKSAVALRMPLPGDVRLVVALLAALRYQCSACEG